MAAPAQLGAESCCHCSIVEKMLRNLLSRTTIQQIDEHPPFKDELFEFINADLDASLRTHLGEMTLGDLRTFLLERSEQDIHEIRNGLSSDVIACVVRLMSNDELIKVGAKVFNQINGMFYACLGEPELLLLIPAVHNGRSLK